MKRYTLIIVLFALLTSHLYHAWEERPTDQLTITALDVGQGDAIYIRTPGGNDILIDGGPDQSLTQELGEVMPKNDTTLELLVATHPDADHIGGLPSLEQHWSVQTILTSGAARDSEVFGEYTRWEEGKSTVVAQDGQYIEVEPDLTLTILNPSDGPGDDINEQSVVILLQYKEFVALFTGDAGTEVEERLLQQDRLPHLNLLKVSHHGSTSGTTREFLEATTPEIALISVGKENRYGHPHPAIIHRLQQFQSKVFRTDINGRITCTTTGGDPACEYEHM